MTAPVTTKVYKELSRHWQLSVNTGTEAAPVFTPVRALNSIALGVDPNEVDTTDFDGAGWDGKMVTHRSWSITASGFRAYTKAAAVRVPDPGQEACVAAGFGTGEDAQIQVQIERDDNGRGYRGWANVSNRNIGGGPKDVEPLNLEFGGDGVLSPYTAA